MKTPLTEPNGFVKKKIGKYWKNSWGDNSLRKE
jgi:hypothetical protein